MQPLIYEPGDAHSLGVDHITVDGRRVDLVVMADPHRGVVDTLVKDKDGRLRVDKYGKRLLTKRHRGKVEVVFNEPA